MNHKETLV